MTKLLPLALLLTFAGWAQTPQGTLEQPDAEHTREELSRLLSHYPPGLREVFALDPTLLQNQDYLKPYPALIGFLNAHPEVPHNPSFYVGEASGRYRRDHVSEVLDGFGVFAGFGMAIGLITWLIRTVLDHRRWNRVANVQSEVHAKLLDRFTANEDLLDYIKSPAGAKFLESSPINLDAGPRSVGAPLGRIIWSVQAGVVLVAAGTGLWFIGEKLAGDVSQPVQALGVLCIALGLGFVLSAAVSFMISRRLGLIEHSSAPPGAAS